SRVRRLAGETPARYVAFDLLASGDELLLERPFDERREALAALVAEPVLLAPCTSDAEQARPWLQRAEGVIAKEADATYRPGELEWIDLRPELVVEVSFDHVSAGRIRHGTKLLRWREDKPPAECRIEQLEA